MAKTPGLRAARQKASFNRTIDFLDLPVKLYGGPKNTRPIVVRPLRVRDIVTLAAIDSPFLCSKAPRHLFEQWWRDHATDLHHMPKLNRQIFATLEGRPLPTADDIVNFLWLLQDDYEPNRLARRWFYLRRCRKLELRHIIPAIYRFMEHTFADAPPASEKAGGPTYYSLAAGLVDLFGSEYGWAKPLTFALSMREALQLRNCIVNRKDPKAAQFESAEEMAAKQRLLNRMNPTRN